MRRTYLLLSCLGLIVALLVVVRLTYRPPAVISQNPSPTATPEPTLFPSVIPLPTPTPTVPNPSYTSRDDLFSLSYPPTWTLKPVSRNSWTLSTGNVASTSAQFTFTLSDSSGSAKPLACAEGAAQCQVIPINAVNYRMMASAQNKTAVQLKYDAVVGEHILKISGTFKGLTDALPTLISEWDVITQSFAWRKTK